MHNILDLTEVNSIKVIRDVDIYHTIYYTILYIVPEPENFCDNVTKVK